jgi:peptide/nickel transport system substrate-binding protein
MRWKQPLLATAMGVALLAAACGGDNKGSTGATTSAPSGGAATTASGSSTTGGSGGASTTGGSGGGAAGCPSGAPSGPGPSTGKTKYTIGATLAPASLDISQESGAAIPEALLYNVYQTLVKLDDSGKFEPLLSKSCTISADGLTYTFTLNDNIVFANGDPLTADTVKKTFDYNAANAKAPAIIKNTFAPVASVTAPDPKTVVITLKQPSRNFLFNLSQTGGVVIDDASRADIATKTNGSGPFTVTNYTTNASLSLAANPKYWGPKPALTDVSFRYFSDANALANALKAGDIDAVDNITPELFDQFKKDTANYNTVQGDSSGEVIVAMNNARKPLDDVRVRQAITYAINKQDVDDIAEQGLATIIGSHASTNDPWYKDLSKTYPYDPDKAKSLLQQAGVSGLNLTLDVIPTPYAQAIAPVVKDDLSKVGINVTLNPVDFSKWLDQDFTQGNFDLTIVAHVEARDTNLYGNPNYYWHYNNPDVQSLLKQADAATDVATSNALYGQVLDKINADAVNDWLFLLPNLEVVRKPFTGYPKGAYSLSYDVTGIS